MNQIKKNLTPFQRIGGRDMLEKIAKSFYDKIYKHPWIGKYFENIPQDHIERQQVDFAQGLLKGPVAFSGRMPKDAHMHMVINDELFDLRNQILRETLEEYSVSKDLIELWINIDASFRKVIVKNHDQAQKRYFSDEILDYKKNQS